MIKCAYRVRHINGNEIEVNKLKIFALRSCLKLALFDLLLHLFYIKEVQMTKKYYANSCKLIYS